ncbi:MAG: hypothetical protein MR285_00810 [Peptoniphilus sp.]|uniref:hypothetical protein n=1 Tax=Peptoniphilus sp. TaxID=1971214 RepID=UPI0025DD953A|nr:hypothetical protein [Peptoniphilus sp.]MCI5642627.1 hypothetical protein [Peptoniphilus sp.]MDD7352658.1 hypothetical protein [Peptoniphilaceae bacterium]MDY3902506.1 hypothetical protein [Peptoniphilus sp.]
MNKKLQNLILAISIIIPFGFHVSGLKSELGQGSFMYSVFWGIINYLFLMTTADFMSKFNKILKLPGLKIRKRTYFINVIVYIGFLIFVNIYFLQQIYLRNVKIINYLASPFVIIGLFLLFLFNLQNGKFLKKDEKETDIYEISKKRSFREGNDVLGTVVGSYEQGLVIGNYYFSYDKMKSISKSKDDEIIIKGKEDSKNYIVKIGSLNSANQVVTEVNNALNQGKIDEQKVNLKKIKNF